jgi:hypothetical protein
MAFGEQRIPGRYPVIIPLWQPVGLTVPEITKINIPFLSQLPESVR